MKIGNVEQGRGADRAKRKEGVSKGGSSSFADQLRGAHAASEVDETESARVERTAPIEGVDALLAMQEVGNATDDQPRRKAVRYGEDLLQRLQTLQDALLMGAIPKDRLMAMAQHMRTSRVKVADPRLNEILDAIELRVEVEIAKYARGR
ncbi:MAG: flagellar assembly protein FliX [Alphaproteobacteria bacterium]|nr:flagellar assembly protein FliX [Alphaproteobacteria bacterium]MBF0249302.1 flagellar assembly protein FliX [Alphaproteobacteria bacterium]